MDRALILVDIQNDFLPTGALPVPDGDAVISFANELASEFELVVASQDWHPANHGSFASNQVGHEPGDIIQLHGVDQVLWPDHCVQGTEGADFAPGLEMDRVAAIFQKGTNPRVDSYSAFFDNEHRSATGMGSYLLEQGVKTVVVCGLATDYCVKFTALDAVALGFETILVPDACRGVGLNPGDVAQAIADMRAAGVQIGR